MRFNELNEENFLIFAIKNYENPQLKEKFLKILQDTIEEKSKIISSELASYLGSLSTPETPAPPPPDAAEAPPEAVQKLDDNIGTTSIAPKKTEKKTTTGRGTSSGRGKDPQSDNNTRGDSSIVPAKTAKIGTAPPETGEKVKKELNPNDPVFKPKTPAKGGSIQKKKNTLKKKSKKQSLSKKVKTKKKLNKSSNNKKTSKRKQPLKKKSKLKTPNN